MGSTSRRQEKVHRSVLALDGSGGVMGELTHRKALRAIATGRAIHLDPRQWTRIEGFPSSMERIAVILFPHAKVQGKIKLLGMRKRAILRRDGYRCQYCGKSAGTIDHVHPRCLGGRSTFENQVAACLRCNNTKSGRTPEQAGMALLRPVPSPREYLEAKLAMACNY